MHARARAYKGDENHIITCTTVNKLLRIYNFVQRISHPTLQAHSNGAHDVHIICRPIVFVPSLFNSFIHHMFSTPQLNCNLPIFCFTYQMYQVLT